MRLYLYLLLALLSSLQLHAQTAEDMDKIKIGDTAVLV